MASDKTFSDVSVATDYRKVIIRTGKGNPPEPSKGQRVVIDNQGDHDFDWVLIKAPENPTDLEGWRNILGDANIIGNIIHSLPIKVRSAAATKGKTRRLAPVQKEVRDKVKELDVDKASMASKVLDLVIQGKISLEDLGLR